MIRAVPALIAFTMPAQIVPGVNSALMAVIPMEADGVMSYGSHGFRARRRLIHRQQRLRFRLWLAGSASGFFALIMAGGTWTSITQPCKAPMAAMAVLPDDFHSGAFGLEDAHLGRGLCFRRKFALHSLASARLCFRNKLNAFVPHVFSVLPVTRSAA